MIEAQHQRWADYIFNIYLNKLLKKNFNLIEVIGGMPATDPELPLIIVPNHSTWWDGFFIYFLNKKFYSRKFYILMLEHQLKRYGFFRKLGAFSIDQEKNTEIIKTIRYTANILNEYPPPLLNFYPQGIMVPLINYDVHFKKGLEIIIKAYNKKLQILPLAMKIVHIKDKLPDVFFKPGQILTFDKNNFPGIDFLQKEVIKNLHIIDEYILKKDSAHRTGIDIV